MDLTLTTELDAVNLMLETIGESPVNTLEVTGLSDVSIAVNTLTQTCREVQEKGWDFNTETLTLSPDADGYINIPESVLKLDPVDRSLPYVRRGRKLYNKKDNTFIFTSTVELEVVYFLDFSDLPQPARTYVTIKAARRFQNKVLGDESVYAYTKEDEQDALAEMKAHEIETGEYNFLKDSTTFLGTFWR